MFLKVWLREEWTAKAALQQTRGTWSLFLPRSLELKENRLPRLLPLQLKPYLSSATVVQMWAFQSDNRTGTQQVLTIKGKLGKHNYLSYLITYLSYDVSACASAGGHRSSGLFQAREVKRVLKQNSIFKFEFLSYVKFNICPPCS